ncbi:hypothetical protein ACFXD5_12175 [Streptomyces sp. NPDC059385]|uniref:hypothetical protein n=1 Tax=Streptomyces sp. NPDC059385 TaxID=3346817 RepID=UPI00368CD505
MSAPTPDIARLNVSLQQLVAALRKPYTPSPQELARRAAAAEHLAQMAAEAGLTPEEYIRLGERAIAGHLLHDADPGAATRPFPDLRKGTPARLIDGGQS